MSKNINIDISILIAENEKLKKEVIELKEHLKRYTFGDNHKRYYEKNKEKVKEGGAKYLQKLKEENPEKLREYWRRAYQNRKQKELLEKIDNSYINI